MLLALSCAAARCEVICEFASAAPACHGAQESAKPESGPAVAAVHDCGMDVRRGIPVMLQPAHSQCVHQVCKQDLARLQNDKNVRVFPLMLQTGAVVPVSGLAYIRPEPVHMARGALPLLQSISPLSTFDSLRV